MKNIITSLTLLVFTTFGISQESKIQDILTLDTLISFPQSNTFRDKISLTCFEDELWVYLPGRRTDTLDFLVMDLLTNEQRFTSCLFPSMYFKIKNPVASNISVNKDYICLHLSAKDLLVILNRKKDVLKFREIVPINDEAYFLKLKGDHLYFAKHYNYHPKSSNNKTLLGKYNLKTNALEDFIVPPFDNIEFSHFNPNKWVAFSDEFNFFSETTTYKIRIYDNQLECIDSLETIKEDWFTLPQDTLNKVYSLARSAKSLIGFMEPIDGEITRVEAIYQMNNDILFVIWIPPYKRDNDLYRKIDVWKKNSNGKFELAKEDLLDAAFDLSEVITKDQFPVRTNFNNNVFYKNKLIQWKFGSGVNPIGKTQGEVIEEEDEYYIENDDQYVIKIFTIKDL